MSQATIDSLVLLLQPAVPALIDERTFLSTEFAAWCRARNVAPRTVRALLCRYITQHAGAKPAHSRRNRRMHIVQLCDLEGLPHKVVSATVGLSRAQFYRERRAALRDLATEVDAFVSEFGAVLTVAKPEHLEEISTLLQGAAQRNPVAAAILKRAHEALTGGFPRAAFDAFSA